MRKVWTLPQMRDLPQHDVAPDERLGRARHRLAGDRRRGRFVRPREDGLHRAEPVLERTAAQQAEQVVQMRVDIILAEIENLRAQVGVVF
jgi:hypothetical protein